MAALRRESTATLTLLQFVEYDGRSALRLLSGLFVIGIGFSAVTLPCCLVLLRDSPVPKGVDAGVRAALGGRGLAALGGGRGAATGCEDDLVVHLHWAMLALFVAIQLAQLPFRLRSFADVFWLGFRAQTYTRESLIESFKAVMERKSWRLNQSLGFLGQYMVPSCGFLLKLALGEASTDAPCDLSADREHRPSSIWAWLLACVAVRVLFTFLWGYHTTSPQLDVADRGAPQSVLDTLDVFVYSSSQEHHLTSCAVCICDFEDGEVIARLPCDGKHIFHKDCVFRWLARRSACPLCMRDIAAGKTHSKVT